MGIGDLLCYSQICLLKIHENSEQFIYNLVILGHYQHQTFSSHVFNLHRQNSSHVCFFLFLIEQHANCFYLNTVETPVIFGTVLIEEDSKKKCNNIESAIENTLFPFCIPLRSIVWAVWDLSIFEVTNALYYICIINRYSLILIRS